MYVGEEYRQIGTKRKNEMDASLAKHRPDMTPEQRADAISEIEKLGEEVKAGGSPKHEKAATKWLLGGHIILPEDNYKILDALKICEQQHLDPMSFGDPNEILAKYTIKESAAEKRVNPDTVSEFSDKKEYPDGITVYAVQNDKAGQAAVRKIIDTHWGEDANPWCLAARGKRGGMTDAWRMWRNYDSIPKRIAFQNGKLLAFCASDTGVTQWWDREDKPTVSISFSTKKNDVLVTHAVNESTGRSTKVKEEYTDGTERWWYENGQLSGEMLPDGTKRGWHENGQLKHEILPDRTERWWRENGQLDHEMLPDGTERWWYENEQLDHERLPYGPERWWYENGQLKHEILPDRTERWWHGDGQLDHERLSDGTERWWHKNGQLSGEVLPYGTERWWYENGQLSREMLPNGTKRWWHENGQLSREMLPDGTKRGWRENGQLSHERLPDGTERWWHKNGQLSGEMLPDGTWREYEQEAEVYNQTAYNGTPRQSASGQQGPREDPGALLRRVWGDNLAYQTREDLEGTIAAIDGGLTIDGFPDDGVGYFLTRDVLDRMGLERPNRVGYDENDPTTWPEGLRKEEAIKYGTLLDETSMDWEEAEKIEAILDRLCDEEARDAEKEREIYSRLEEWYAGHLNAMKYDAEERLRYMRLFGVNNLAELYDRIDEAEATPASEWSPELRAFMERFVTVTKYYEPFLGRGPEEYAFYEAGSDPGETMENPTRWRGVPELEELFLDLAEVEKNLAFDDDKEVQKGLRKEKAGIVKEAHAVLKRMHKELDALIDEDEARQKALWAKAEEAGIKVEDDQRPEETYYQIIGRRGAEALDAAEEGTTRLDNLNVAREMEQAGKDARAIRLATGWERGADGKWGYETPDGTIPKGLSSPKKREGKAFPLPDIFESPYLYTAYPFLRDFMVSFETNMDPAQRGGVHESTKKIRLNYNYVKDAEELAKVLVHEIQHMIQYHEGFSGGTNPKEFSPPAVRKLGEYLSYRHYRAARDILQSVSPEVKKVLLQLDTALVNGKDIESMESGLSESVREAWAKYKHHKQLERERLEDVFTNADAYINSWGEVQARNVANRLPLTDEERANTLLSETEDIEREAQLDKNELFKFIAHGPKAFGDDNAQDWEEAREAKRAEREAKIAREKEEERAQREAEKKRTQKPIDEIILRGVKRSLIKR